MQINQNHINRFRYVFDDMAKCAASLMSFAKDDADKMEMAEEMNSIVMTALVISFDPDVTKIRCNVRDELDKQAAVFDYIYGALELPLGEGEAAR